jgi:hypothetical protein
MAARFQSDIHVSPLSLHTGTAQRMDLGMRSAGLAVPPFANYPAFPNNDTTNRRVGRGPANPLPGQDQGTTHELKMSFP